ncbi:MAG: hypothetical protein AB1938_03535 [Myxococcota bacterium]
MRPFVRTVGLALLLGWALARADEPGPSAAALVRFHTACASCHARECSGRQSFQSGLTAARGHILRYAPSANPEMVRQLFDLLAETKRACRVVLPPADVARPRWTAEQLRPWFNPDIDAWFIPLGTVHPPGADISLEVARATASASAELLDEELETLTAEPVREGRARLVVEATVPTRVFLLLRGVSALRGVALERR